MSFDVNSRTKVKKKKKSEKQNGELEQYIYIITCIPSFIKYNRNKISSIFYFKKGSIFFNLRLHIKLKEELSLKKKKIISEEFVKLIFLDWLVKGHVRYT